MGIAARPRDHDNNELRGKIMKIRGTHFCLVLMCLFAMAGTAQSKDMAQPQTLKELIAKAKASNHVVTIIHENVSREVLKAKEKAFKKRFGFGVRVQYQPGHHRDIPVKIMEAAKHGRGVVDMWRGGIPLVMGMFKNGNTRLPPWKAIEQGWPLVKQLRKVVPRVAGGPHGAVLSDHCMQSGYTGWTIAYSPLRVKKSELKGLKYEDLTTDKWRNRVVWDVRALGLYVLPFAPGWDVERMRVFAHNLGANGAKLVSGGTSGVMRALLQGEADIGVAAMLSVVQRKNLGAPIDIAFADFLMGNLTVTCLISPGVDDPNMAALYWAWANFDGWYEDARLTEAGTFRFVKQEEKYFPIVRLAIKNGIDSDKKIIGPKTAEEAKKAGKYRRIAIKALKAGVRSKKKITR